MLCIISKETNPYFNLAAEEYFFKNFEDDIFFLYINSPAVVIGKHQNALAEINHEFVQTNNVAVIRRLSGGGAVYHDLGNLNFSFHRRVNDPSKISFKLFNEPIVQLLNEMGVAAEISKRNDIFVEGFKVSGHAEHVFRNRILSHGTLLFNSNRENLSKALKNQSGEFQGKAIQSVRSKVANITDFLPYKMSIDDFIVQIQELILKINDNSKTYSISDADNEAIIELIDKKYANWDWNFAYSPKYQFEKEIFFNKGKLKITIWVEKGLFTDIKIQSEGLNVNQTDVINGLLNKQHRFEPISQILNNLKIKLPEKKLLLSCFF